MSALQGWILGGAIGEALTRGIPVLVGLNPLNAPAFLDFTAGLANELQPNEADLLDWIRETAETPDGQAA